MEVGLLKWVHTQLHAIVWLNYSMKYISLLYEGGALCIILCAVLLMFKNTRGFALYLFASLVINVIVVNLVLKNIVARPRPYTRIEGLDGYFMRYGIAVTYDFSFPSGHTSAAFCTAAATRFYYGNKPYTAVLYVVAALVGLSRVFLCVHYPTDVLFGALFGVLCAAAVNAVYRYAKRRV